MMHVFVSRFTAFDIGFFWCKTPSERPKLFKGTFLRCRPRKNSGLLQARPGIHQTVGQHKLRGSQVEFGQDRSRLFVGGNQNTDRRKGQIHVGAFEEEREPLFTSKSCRMFPLTPPKPVVVANPKRVIPATGEYLLFQKLVRDIGLPDLQVALKVSVFISFVFLLDCSFFLRVGVATDA